MTPDATAAFRIGSDTLTLDIFTDVCRGSGISVSLAPPAREKVRAGHAFRRQLAGGQARVYGVNTGFGRLADTVIPPEDQAALQANLVRSHAVGWGRPLDRDEARGMILLRAMSLSHGHSGVREDVVDQLLWLLEADVTPWIPSRGSVGASGDLAPLSHLALVLMGEGHVLAEDGEREAAGPVLRRLGRKPLALEAKEGLALINGTQLMNSLGLLAVARAGRLLRSATVAAGLSLEAIEGSEKPLGEAYHALRPHRGILDVAASLRDLLAGSGVMAAHQGCTRVQDPYSIRCAPQVLGASLDVVRGAAEVFLREAGAVTDNPVLFPETGEVVTGGHFHGQPLAFQLDFVYQAVCEVANIAERRVNLLLGGNGGRLPRFLAARPGLESGLMIAQYLAAALVTENKSKAWPAAVDSVPTSDGQEDHVSMGSVSALKLPGVLARCEAVVALELLTASRALQFIADPVLAAVQGREPLALSGPLAEALDAVAGVADVAPGDRPLTDDVEAVSALVGADCWPEPVAACLRSLRLPSPNGEV